MDVEQKKNDELKRLEQRVDELRAKLQKITEGDGETRPLIVSVEGVELSRLKEIYHQGLSKIRQLEAKLIIAEDDKKSIENEKELEILTLNQQIKRNNTTYESILANREELREEIVTLNVQNQRLILNNLELNEELNDIREQINANFTWFRRSRDAKTAVKRLIAENQRLGKYEPSFIHKIGDWTGIN